MFSSLMFSGVGAKAKGLMRNLTTVKRNALSLKHDKEGGSKYVHGMKEVRIQTAEVCLRRRAGPSRQSS